MIKFVDWNPFAISGLRGYISALMEVFQLGIAYTFSSVAIKNVSAIEAIIIIVIVTLNLS